MTHLSLFSGIGGLDLAAEMAGFRTVGQVEIDDYCNRVLEYHWPNVPRWRDVKDVTAETFEQKTGIKPGTLALLSGGFPCQPVSCAGQRKGDTDERWLWDEMLRVICEIRPRWVVAENVRGLLSAQAISDGRKLFGRILRDLAQSGYRVGWLCYGAGDVGAPHKRERVFIVAHSASAQCHAGAEVKRVLRGVPENGQKHGYPDRSGETRNLADACREGLEIGQCFSRNFKQEQQTAKRGCKELADAPQQLLNRPRQTGPAGRGEFADGSNVADPDVMHREQCRPSGRMGWEGEPDQGDERGQRPTQSGMGRNFDGPPAGLAGYRWPAGPGPQYPWEPPRIATGVKDRVEKLKALGDAVVPAQAYPIFRAIAEIVKC
ncbi:DNA cytosine methyltransferase [Candidatus Darwinibacter acetoxidans]